MLGNPGIQAGRSATGLAVEQENAQRAIGLSPTLQACGENREPPRGFGRRQESWSRGRHTPELNGRRLERKWLYCRQMGNGRKRQETVGSGGKRLFSAGIAAESIQPKAPFLGTDFIDG